MNWPLVMAQQIGGEFGNIFILLLLSLVAIAFVLVPLVASWRIFAKAGQPGWAALIPIYNLVVLLRIVGRPLWWLLLLFVPVANMIIPFILTHDLSRAFGKDIGFTLGLIFLSPIFILILAFGPAQYVGARTDDAAPGQPYAGAGEPAEASSYTESGGTGRLGSPVEIIVATLAVLLLCGLLGVMVSLLGSQAGRGTISIGTTVSGTLDNPYETQDWIFEGQAGQTVTIRCDPVAGEETDPKISLIGPDDETLAQDDDGGGDYSALIDNFALPADGVYTIQVDSWLSGGYELTFEENTDESTNATDKTIDIGGTASGRLTDWTPTQDWTFEGQAGQVITVRCDPIIGEKTDPAITLLGPDGESLAEDDDSGRGDSALIVNVALPVDGTYTIQVATFSDSNGHYNLALVDLIEKGAIEIGSTVSGTLANQSEMHDWTFEGQAGQTVTFHNKIVAGEAIYPMITLLDPDGESLAESDNSYDGISATIDNVALPVDGVYKVRLALNSDFAGDYDLAFQEPIEKGVIEIGSNISDSLTGTWKTQTHVWTFEGRAGQTVTLRCNPASYASTDPKIVLFDPDGQILAEGGSDVGDTDELIDTFPLTVDGRYTIWVYSRFHTGNYELLLEEAAESRLIEIGNTVSESLTDSFETHDWIFAGQTGQTVTIRCAPAAGEEIDPRIVLLGPDGQILAQGNSIVDDTGELIDPFPLTADGMYRIQVSNGSYSGNYELLLEETAESKLIEVGSTTSALISDRAETHNWIFAGQAGQTITIRCAPAAGEKIKPTINLFGPDGELLKFDFRNDHGTSVSIDTFALPVDGMYRIQVGSWQDTSGGYELFLE